MAAGKTARPVPAEGHPGARPGWAQRKGAAQGGLPTTVNKCKDMEKILKKEAIGSAIMQMAELADSKGARLTVEIETDNGQKVVVRQIAGALARRIVCYAKEGEYVQQGAELGFIKFGSRVDLFIPLESQVHAEIEDKVKGGLSVLATL